MARVIISEYAAKKILTQDVYAGIHVSINQNGWKDQLVSLSPNITYVVKVDQGEKKRFKRGLIALDVSFEKISEAIDLLSIKGFDRFLVEPYTTHEIQEERYLSCELVRDGWQLLWSEKGGIDVESGEGAQTHHIPYTCPKEVISSIAKNIGVTDNFLVYLITQAKKHHLSFIEINPLIINEQGHFLLDAAVRVDSEAVNRLPDDSWSEKDVIIAKDTHPAERAVANLDATTPASLKLSVLNPDGDLFFLLSSGGASIVNVDHAYNTGHAKEIANYGEYSGAPTREETNLYAREVIKLLLVSKSNKKTLIISGGVANFTDVAKTFSGIIDALKMYEKELVESGISIYVRRGGPHEKEGLELMEEYLRKSGLLGAVYGSHERLTRAVGEGIDSLVTSIK